jgi:hypothetical protein
VPAAGAMALGLALGSKTAFGEAGAQLGINLVGILVAATATLLVQRTVWRRVPGATHASPGSGARRRGGETGRSRPQWAGRRVSARVKLR